MHEPKEKLTVKVAYINSVHVNDVNVLESREREIGKNLAAKSAGTNDEDLTFISEE